ncbi:hypothetical protein EUGRSUZ_G02755 [Eucalyptus grandis]|uniref:Uncharacterized protein n=2 Tax=Eucalyptus grandis TaxID=71139 RepID=A0ACC3K9Q9_EUCGR|nr:hypothetical protein EUGRSUZ_G02755 [Eucalyptus grandis]
MAREMEVANWNLDEAIRLIESRARFAKPGHQHFAIESFVARSIFERFNFPNFTLANESSFAKAKYLQFVHAKHKILTLHSGGLVKETACQSTIQPNGTSKPQQNRVTMHLSAIFIFSKF